MKNVLFILLMIPMVFSAQLSEKKQAEVDSLKQIIKTAQHDSIIVNAWSAWSDIIYKYQPEMDFMLSKKIDSLCTVKIKKGGLNDEEKIFYLQSSAYSSGNMGIYCKNHGMQDEAIQHYKKCLKIHQENGNKKGEATALNNFGSFYREQGQYDVAFDYYTKSLKARESTEDLAGMAGTLNAIGSILSDQGDYNRGIEYYNKSLKIKEEIGDEHGIAVSYLYIGNLYLDQNNNEKALDYYQKSLTKYDETGDIRGVSGMLINIGIVYDRNGDQTKAIDSYFKALAIQEEIDDPYSVASTLINIGTIYRKQGKLDEAMKNQQKSLEIFNLLGNKTGASTCLNNIALIYFDKGLFQNAIEYSVQSLEIAQEINSIKQIKDASEALWEEYKATNQFQKALEMHELYIQAKDSISSESNQSQIIRQEFKYSYEKQSAKDSVVNAEAQKVKDAQIAVEKAQNKQHLIEGKQQKQFTYFLFGVLALALLFGGFIFNRFRITRKQKEIIQTQKGQVDLAFDELEMKNKEILDSINYAKRIQSAILPQSKVVKEYLNNSFILYKPKDIVAGDFYWMERRDNKILFAAADCTGHGVPGAMVSVVCNNGLNRSVREHNLVDPGQILDKTREIVIEEFEKSEDEVKDGMDIALCSLEGNKLEYAGAHNPLWIIRNGEILETKADKQPIGKFDNQLPYTTHRFELEIGDSIYIFSDGYVDQFGGEKGKKFKSVAFKELLLSIQNNPMEKQRTLIDEAFETWRGDLEQIDDVCVIGVRI